MTKTGDQQLDFFTWPRVKKKKVAVLSTPIKRTRPAWSMNGIRVKRV
jgi:hypothetical protein